jgi:hypothetical protein
MRSSGRIVARLTAQRAQKTGNSIGAVKHCWRNRRDAMAIDVARRVRRRELTGCESQRSSRTSQYRIGGIAKDERLPDNSFLASGATQVPTAYDTAVDVGDHRQSTFRSLAPLELERRPSHVAPIPVSVVLACEVASPRPATDSSRASRSHRRNGPRQPHLG